MSPASQDGGRFRRATSLRPFLLWLIIVYTAWLAIVVLGGFWDDVLSHWPISVAMAAGSYFAGSTPMGGGAVGFPVLVLIFDQPASLGRNFALAVQSVGLASATIFILCTRRPIDWALLKPAIAGMLIGMPVGAALIAPVVPDLGVKLAFAAIWASFGLLHFAKLRAICAARGLAGGWRGVDVPVGVAIGVVGGVLVSVTGVGIELMMYAVLVLLYRADLKVAIPTAVILLACTSVVGIASNLLLWAASGAEAGSRYAVDVEVLYNWLAAVPVVVVGAPTGALMLTIIPRPVTLMIVSALCIGQFIWMMFSQRVSTGQLTAALGGVAALSIVFYGLFTIGGRRAAARTAAETASP